MSDIGLHWTAFNLASIVLLAGAPGLLYGLVLGAMAGGTRRVLGAMLGAAAGAVLCIAFVLLCFRSSIALANGLAGGAWLALKVCWPGFVLGAMLAAWRFGDRWIVAGLCGGPVGAVAALGIWAALF